MFQASIMKLPYCLKSVGRRLGFVSLTELGRAYIAVIFIDLTEI